MKNPKGTANNTRWETKNWPQFVPRKRINCKFSTIEIEWAKKNMVWFDISDTVIWPNGALFHAFTICTHIFNLRNVTFFSKINRNNIHSNYFRIKVTAKTNCQIMGKPSMNSNDSACLITTIRNHRMLWDPTHPDNCLKAEQKTEIWNRVQGSLFCCSLLWNWLKSESLELIIISDMGCYLFCHITAK